MGKYNAYVKLEVEVDVKGSITGQEVTPRIKEELLSSITKYMESNYRGKKVVPLVDTMFIDDIMPVREHAIGFKYKRKR
jgi:hypothetical protein